MKLTFGYIPKRKDGNEEMKYFKADLEEHESAAIASMMERYNAINNDIREVEKISEISAKIEAQAIECERQNSDCTYSEEVKIETLFEHILSVSCFYPEEFRNCLTVWELQKGRTKTPIEQMTDRDICVILSTCGTVQGKIAYSRFLKDKDSYRRFLKGEENV